MKLRSENIEVSIQELETLVDDARKQPLSEENHRKLKGAIQTLAELARMLAEDVTVRALCRRSCHANFRSVCQIPFGVWKGRLDMLACQWDRIHACIGKPSIPLDAERKSSLRKAPTKSVSGPSSRLILRG